MYYVYVYKDPETLVPFYVGKGCKRRWRKHLFETWDNTTNKMRLSKIISIRMKEREPVVEFISTDLTEQDALDLEEKLIAEYGRQINNSGVLTNILEGGDQPPRGVGNPSWSDPTQNPSSINKGKTYEERYGAERASSMKKQRSSSLKGRTFSDETKQKMKVSARKRTDRSYQQKCVITPLGEFSSMQEAAKALNISPSALTRRVQSTKWSDHFIRE